MFDVFWRFLYSLEYSGPWIGVGWVLGRGFDRVRAAVSSLSVDVAQDVCGRYGSAMTRSLGRNGGACMAVISCHVRWWTAGQLLRADFVFLTVRKSGIYLFSAGFNPGCQKIVGFRPTSFSHVHTQK